MKTCKDPMILSQESIIGVRINNPRGSECDIQLSGSTFHVEAWDSFLFLPKNTAPGSPEALNNIKSDFFWTYTTGHVGIGPIGPLENHNSPDPVPHPRYPMTPRRCCRTAADWPMQALAIKLIHIFSLVAMAEKKTAPRKNGWFSRIASKCSRICQMQHKNFMWLYVAIIFWGCFFQVYQGFSNGWPTSNRPWPVAPQSSTGSWGRQSQTSTGAVSTDLGNSWIYQNLCVYKYYIIYIYCMNHTYNVHMVIYIYTYIHTCMHACIHTIPYHPIPSHPITSHYIPKTLHTKNITLHYITWHDMTWHDITLLHTYMKLMCIHMYIIYIYVYNYKYFTLTWNEGCLWKISSAHLSISWSFFAQTLSKGALRYLRFLRFYRCI